MSLLPHHVLVVVPAHNEATRIGRTLDALDIARRGVVGVVSTSVVVVADACSDSTAARAMLRLETPADCVLSVAVRCAGEARRLGVEVGLATAGVPLDRVWIASTDADTIVPPEWLRTHVEYASGGSDALAGIVRLSANEAPEHLVAAFDATYALGSDGRHEHVHAANLGLRADVYRNSGGWASMRSGEDHALWAALRSTGHSPISSTNLWVTTSARLSGRAPDGFASDLRALERSVA